MANTKPKIKNETAVGKSPPRSLSNVDVCVDFILILLVLLGLTFAGLLLFASVMKFVGQNDIDAESECSYCDGKYIDFDAPKCGSMRFIGKRSTSYVTYSSLEQNATRCAFPIFSDSKKVVVSIITDSFPRDAGIVVGQVRNGGYLNGFETYKLDPSQSIMANTPLVLYFTSYNYTTDGEPKEIRFVVKVASIENSGPADRTVGMKTMVNTMRGFMPLFYPCTDALNVFALFEEPYQNPRGRWFICVPPKSPCCSLVSAYRMSTFRDGGISSKLTRLNSADGDSAGAGETVVMFFGSTKNASTKARGSKCHLVWAEMAVPSALSDEK